MCMDASSSALMLTIMILEYDVRQTQQNVLSPKSCIMLVLTSDLCTEKACTDLNVVCLTLELVDCKGQQVVSFNS